MLNEPRRFAVKKLIAAVVVVLATAGVAHATPIAVCGPGGCNFDVGIIDLGIYEPLSGDGGSAWDQLAILNTVIIPAYNGSNDPDLLDATYGTDNIGGTGLTINLNLGEYDYLKLKWNGHWQYYYVGATVGEVQFNSTVFNQNQQPQNLSHYTWFSPRQFDVPDGGSVAMLLGMALIGLAGVRRMIK
jgi:hypothetical protein